MKNLQKAPNLKTNLKTNNDPSENVTPRKNGCSG